MPPANFIKIPELVSRLCNELNSESQDPIAILARTHAVFGQIHPFYDGNGRAGRLLMLIRALQFGIVPLVVPKERKAAYYRYLELAKTQDRFDNLELFIA